MHRDTPEEQAAPCVDAREGIDAAFAEDESEPESEPAPGELSAPPLLRADTIRDPHDPDADEDAENQPQEEPPPKQRRTFRVETDDDAELREEAEAVKVRRNETLSATGAVFVTGGSIDRVPAGVFVTNRSALGARLGLRYFPMASSWSAAALIEASLGNTGFEVGLPLRLEIGYFPESIGLKLPSVRIGGLAHPFFTVPGTGSTTRSGVRAAAIIGYSLPIALTGAPTLGKSLSAIGGGLLLLMGLVPYAGPFLVLAGGAAMLLLATPELTVGVEYGRDALFGSYSATYVSFGVGI